MADSSQPLYPTVSGTKSAPSASADPLMGLRVIGRLLGMLLVVLGCTMAVCLFWCFYDRQYEAGMAIGASVAVTEACGLLLFFWGKNSRTTVYRREALAVVGLGWICSGVFGALPYIFAGTFDNFIDAYFEAVSGFTTTGATVLVDIEVLPRGILFWRMLTQWLGGMGIIVLFTALFAHLGVGAKQLFRTETPGPITESLRPKIKETALAMWKIYTFFTAVVTGLLLLCGLDFFEALTHAFTTIATSGYSTKNASIGHFDSVAVEAVVIVFMFVAGVNFSLYYQVLQGQWKGLWRNSEFRVYGIICAVAILVIAVDIYVEVHADPAQALRYAAFQAVAILTTTGFATDDFDAYPALSRMVLLCLMCIGGCAGSTAGSVKVSRIMVLVKVAYQEVYHIFRPQVQLSVKIGRSLVAEEVTRSILVFAFTFVLFFVLGSIYMAALGLDLITAAASVIACLANIGPGLGGVGPALTYADIPAPGKVFLSFCMLLGRLELGALLVLLLPSFWRRVIRQ